MRVVLVAILALASGCVRVRPWQRGNLAAPCMETPFADNGVAGVYRAKVIESKTGGGAPGVAPGGGCGCTQ